MSASDAPARQSRTYYNAGARPVAVRTWANVPGVAAQEVQYLHPDHLGSIGQITSQTGAWVQDVYFYPYGGIRWSRDGGTTPSPASATRRTYTGQYDIGYWAGAIQHYNARQYDYVLGRFLQPDGIVPNPGDPMALNRFMYVRGNPINATDPTGHFAWIAAGAVIGAAVVYGFQVWSNIQNGVTGTDAFTQNIDLYAIGAGALVGATAVAAAPLIVAAAGEAVMGAGLLTGSTAVFGAGMAVSAAATPVASTIYGPGAGTTSQVVGRAFDGSQEVYDDFMTTVRSGLPPNTDVVLRGSAVNNRSWMTGRPFDGRGPGSSDLDIALIGDDVMNQWSPSAFYVPGQNSMPLSDASQSVASASLNSVRLSAQALVGRPVNFQATTWAYLNMRRLLLNQPYMKLE